MHVWTRRTFSKTGRFNRNHRQPGQRPDHNRRDDVCRRAMRAVLVPTGGAGRLLTAACAAVAFGLVWTPSAQAQGRGGNQVAFTATVRDTHQTAQRVSVPRNSSVIIETSKPFSRIDLAGTNIVRAEAPTATQLLIQGQEYGVTQVVIWTEEGDRHVIEVTVEIDLEMLNQTIAELDPQADATARSMLGNVILMGTVSSADAAERIMQVAQMYLSRIAPDAQVQNQLRVAGEQQVLLKVVVAEVSRSAVRELGVNGFLAGDGFRDGFLVNQINGINPIDIAPAEAVNVVNPIPFITGDNVQLLRATTLSLGFPDAQMQLFIRALADNTLLRVLAEPTLVAVSGETASFLAGGEFPIPIPQSGQAAGAITVEFKEFGVNLGFTPLVLPHQRIRLHVRPEVSTRDETGGIVTPSGFVPAITTRRSETTVEMASGSTIAIAGLLQDEVRGIASSVPGIGDLPVLGALFRSVNYQRSRSELVILVTPEIVAPMTPMQVPVLPGQNLTDPTDVELYFGGLLEGKPGGSASDDESAELSLKDLIRSEPTRLSLHGPWGYADLEE